MAAPTRIGGPALAALLPAIATMPKPVYAALADAVAALVVDGRVATETRLPSERELAAALRISRATVTASYDALRESGFLTSRTGSGSFVTVPPGTQVGSTLARWPAPALDLNSPDVIDLSCATLPAPRAAMAGAVAAAAERLDAYLATNGYAPAGVPELREVIAARFTARGVPTRAEQVLVTNGALHALDLVMRLLVGPGDRVLTELPTYPGALDAARANGGRVVPVPLAPTGGWQTEQLQATFRQTAPRLAYLIPDFHNPTGALVPEADRRAVFRTARQTGTTVVVDESFVDLAFDPDARERPSAAVDPSVVTVGSLSKPVWGGLRVGWLRGSVDLVQRLAALRLSIDMGGAVIDQLTAVELIGRIDEIVTSRVGDLVDQHAALLTALHERLPGWRAQPARGGLSLWCELDAPLSTPLTMLAAQAGVVAVAGSRFGVDGTLERFLRLPFTLSAARLVEAVDRLADTWERLPSAAGSGLGFRPLVVA